MAGDKTSTHDINLTIYHSEEIYEICSGAPSSDI